MGDGGEIPTYSFFESFDFLNMYKETPTAMAAVPMIATVFPDMIVDVIKVIKVMRKVVEVL